LEEAKLLETYTITDGDLATLAANRAKTVQTYLLQSGQVTASRLFLKNQTAADLRRQGSRVYLQFR
jgi:methionine salvage enolase-phosphatase E1